MGIQFEQSDAEIVVTYGEFTDQEYLDHQEEILRRLRAAKKATALISVATARATIPSSVLRKRSADDLVENAMLYKSKCKGIAFVAESSMLRGVVTAVEWITEGKRPVPYAIFSSIKHARRWLATIR